MDAEQLIRDLNLSPLNTPIAASFDEDTRVLSWLSPQGHEISYAVSFSSTQASGMKATRLT